MLCLEIRAIRNFHLCYNAFMLENKRTPQQIITELARVLAQNEPLLRTKTAEAHQAIKQSYDAWIPDGKREATAALLKHERIEGDTLTPEERAYAVGMLGLARQRHVDLNAQLAQRERPTEEVLAEIEQVIREVFDQYDLNDVDQKTIHGAAIDWVIEHEQDLGRTAELTGNLEQAIQHFRKAILHVVAQLKNTSDPEQQAALESGRAVNEVRLGRTTGDQQTIWMGLWRQRQANKKLRNEARLNDLSKMSLKTAVTDWRDPLSFSRVKTMVYAGQRVLRSKLSSLMKNR